VSVPLNVDLTRFPSPSYTKVAFENGGAGVAVGVLVAVGPGVFVRVGVGPDVGVKVGIFVGPLEVWITSCGALAPSRLE
jgi:hypothetical protein